MDQPAYFPLTKEQTPIIESEDKLVKANIVSGELLGVKGPVPSLSPVNSATLEFEKGGKIYIPLPQNHNAFIYLLDGKLTLEGCSLVEALHAVVLKNDGEGISIEALEDTRILLMSGEPLNEKVVAQGPFVMNSETQILEAMRDYQMGKMGVLIES